MSGAAVHKHADVEDRKWKSNIHVHVQIRPWYMGLDVKMDYLSDSSVSNCISQNLDIDHNDNIDVCNRANKLV